MRVAIVRFARALGLLIRVEFLRWRLAWATRATFVDRIAIVAVLMLGLVLLFRTWA